MPLVSAENISIKEEYQDRSTGQTKAKWHKIGELLTFSDNNGEIYKKVKLITASGVSMCSVFEQTKREDAQKNIKQEFSQETPDDDIPF